MSRAAAEVTSDELYKRVVHSGFWVFALRGCHQVFYVARIIVLAKILSPTDFGLFGIALLAASTLETFTQTGLHSALIQKRENIERYLNSVWTVAVIRGVVLGLIVFVSAPYVAQFFDSPRAAPIMRVVALSILLQALTNIGVIYFQKELEFRKQFIYEVVGTLADFVVAVTAALIYKSAWALVLGLIAGDGVRCIASYLIHPYRPRFCRELSLIKGLWGFGRWIAASNVLVFFLTRGDDMLVGKVLGPAALGLYQMAYKISNVPATEISHMISRIAYPAYSKLQHDVERVRVAYVKVLQLTSFLSFPISALMILFAHDFVRMVLGEKWLPMVPAMQVLSLFGLTRSLNATTGPLLQAINKPYILTLGSAIQLVIFILIIYPLTKAFGLVGVSLSVLLPNIFFALYIAVRLVNQVGIRCTKLLKGVALPSVGCIVMCIASFVINSRFETSLAFLVLNIVAGAAFYIGFSFLAQKYFDFDIPRSFLRFLWGGMSRQ